MSNESRDPRTELLKIVDFMESLWLENQAAKILLEEHGVPHPDKLLQHYIEMPEHQAQARQHFLLVRSALQSAAQDSVVLDTFVSKLLQITKETRGR